MADWLSGMANQAEQILNNIDQAAADKLQEATRPGDHVGKRSALRGGNWGGASASRSSAATAAADRWDTGSPSALASSSREHERDQRDRDRVRWADSSGGSSRNTGSKATLSSSKIKKDITSEQLFDFLNDSSSSASKKPSNSTGSASEKPGVSSTSDHRTPKKASSVSADRAAKLLAARDDSASAVESSGNDPVALKATCLQLDNENKLLRREVTALSDEVSTFATRVRSTQDALTDSREALAEAERKLTKAHGAKRDFLNAEQQLEAELTDRNKELELLRTSHSELETQVAKLEKEKLTLLTGHADASESHSTQLQKVTAKLAALEKSKDDNQSSLEASKNRAESKLAELESLCETLKGNLASANESLEEKESARKAHVTEIAKTSGQLVSLQQELDDYKSRAARVLQTKEKTIDDLRAAAGGAVGSGGSPSSVEAIELKRERDALNDELKELRETVDRLRVELQDVDQQHQEENDMADGQLKDLEKAVKDLQRAKTTMEREHAIHVQDLKFSLEELQRFKQSSGAESIRKEAEISKLQGDLARLSKSTSGTATTQLELKIRALTDNVLGKQSQIEALSAEKQSLTLQLEHERKKPQQEVRIEIPVRNKSRNNLRDPYGEHNSRLESLSSIIGDSSSDGDLGPGLRRIKHAANTLDTLSIQLGVFLRRYPAARILVIFYIFLLHLWVLIVIMTYSPEMHDHHLAEHGPVHPDHVQLADPYDPDHL